jgi:hypothetical protein
MKLSSQKVLRLGVVLVGFVVVYSLFSSYSGGKGAVGEKLWVAEYGGTGPMAPQSDQGPMSVDTSVIGGNAVAVDDMQGRTPSSQQTYTQNVLSSSELLPKGEIGASWAAVNPVGSKDLDGQNFLQAGYHANINIIGIAQTNRNPTYDIRSETPNPQSKVGPFLQTTIDPDPFRANRSLDGLQG